MGMCKDCGKVFSVLDMTEGYCKECFAKQPAKIQAELLKGNDPTEVKVEAPKEDSRKLTVGVVGALLLIFGVFAPFMHILVIGDIAFFDNGRGDGVIVLILSVIALSFVLKHSYDKLWIFGSINIVLIALTFLFVKNHFSKQADLLIAMGSLKESESMLMQRVYQIEWGTGILLVGSILLIVASSLNSSVKE